MSDLEVTYLGHSTVAIAAREALLLTDPLLRPSLFGFLRRRRPLVQPWRKRRPAGVLISHADHDHLDLGSLMRLPRGTPILVPEGVAPLLHRAGFGPVIELAEGEETTLGELTVEAVPARHEARRRGVAVGAEVGYLVGDGSGLVYFAGDTDIFPGMRLLGERQIDIALLPIGGWGPTLGDGHMDPARAAESLRMLRPRAAVPIHWGTYTPAGAGRIFPWLTDGPQHRFAEAAADRAPGVAIHALEPGESLRVDRLG